jgi:hypothetical protein
MLAVLDLRAGILLAGKAGHNRLYFIRLSAQAAQPHKYASGLSCVAACSIMVPAVPGI